MKYDSVLEGSYKMAHFPYCLQTAGDMCGPLWCEPHTMSTGVGGFLHCLGGERCGVVGAQLCSQAGLSVPLREGQSLPATGSSRHR
jgi:hypothetical protein